MACRPAVCRGVRVLGERGLVEVAVLGYYGFVSMTLNTFAIGLPEALQPDLAAVGEAA